MSKETKFGKINIEWNDFGNFTTEDVLSNQSVKFLRIVYQDKKKELILEKILNIRFMC